MAAIALSSGVSLDLDDGATGVQVPERDTTVPINVEWRSRLCLLECWAFVIVGGGAELELANLQTSQDNICISCRRHSGVVSRHLVQSLAAGFAL